MNRGDIVVAAGPGDAGKPRPWIVLRSDRFSAHHRVTLLPLTSEVRDEPFLRVDVAPSADNGLRVPSRAMVDRSAMSRQCRRFDAAGWMSRWLNSLSPL